MIIRIRSQLGTWRVTLPDKSSLGDLRAQVAAEHGVAPQEQALSLDPAGRQALDDDAAGLAAAGLSHGCMIHLKLTTAQAAKTSAATSESVATGKKISQDGSIVQVTYEDHVRKKGFRPGMKVRAVHPAAPRARPPTHHPGHTQALSDMKKSWTLTDFLAMDDQFVFKIKKQDDSKCKHVTCDAAVVTSLSGYMAQFNWQRCRCVGRGQLMRARALTRRASPQMRVAVRNVR